jgi:hypothetical protein
MIRVVEIVSSLKITNGAIDELCTFKNVVFLRGWVKRSREMPLDISIEIDNVTVKGIWHVDERPDLAGLPESYPASALASRTPPSASIPLMS